MLDIVKKHLADYAAGNWDDYRASLANDLVYEEFCTRQRTHGIDDYVNVVQRWKSAFPDLKATIRNSFVADDNVVIEVEWEGTNTGPLEGPFGTISPTRKRGSVQAVLVFKLKDGKIRESRHYFDLLTVLEQLGVTPMLTAPQRPSAPGAATTPAKHR